MQGEQILRALTILFSGLFDLQASNNWQESLNHNNQGLETPFKPFHPMGWMNRRNNPVIPGNRGDIGGYVNFLCPIDTPIPIFGRCDLDCQGQHGAVGGRCGDWKNGDYNCYCGASTGQRNDQSFQCQKDTADYRLVCDMDCKCNHAATGGVCDFNRKSCDCQNVGTNKKNRGCEYKTVKEISVFFRDHLPPLPI